MGDEFLTSHMGLFINHKDPYKPTSVMGCKMFYFQCSTQNKGGHKDDSGRKWMAGVFTHFCLERELKFMIYRLVGS